jgi:hypothetical protein
MRNVVMLCVIMLNASFLSFAILYVDMLSTIMQSVVMLNVDNTP